MKRGNWIRRAMALGLCITALSAQALSAKAAGMTQEDAFRAVFDAEYYYNTYTDLQTAIGMDEEALFSHFVNNGIREGRSGMADFNLRAYIQNNADLMQTF